MQEDFAQQVLYLGLCLGTRLISQKSVDCSDFTLHRVWQIINLLKTNDYVGVISVDYFKAPYGINP